MANLGEHLTATFTNIGLDVDNPALTELVKKVATIDMPEELVKTFNSSYLTLEAAKNNSSIINHVKAQVYNGEDKNHNDLMDKYQFDDETKALLKTEKSTPKRRDLLIEKIAELSEKKAGASPGEKTTLTKQIGDLNAALEKYKTSHVPKEELDKANSGWKDKFTDVYKTQTLSGYNYASPLAKEENFLLPKTKINAALKEKNLRIVFDNDTYKLEKEDGSEYYEDNKLVDFKGFTDRVLAQNKLLAASTPPPTQAAPQRQTSNGKPGLDNSKFMAAIDKLEAEQALVNK